ncbi:hypothetical protein GCM10022255_094660 [Dactylosporangium darangshiense]|uniref:Uncharacterized protein n=1 Tax=Dactylosporangium darangshiense TaxID=579108 RepID=A0ABP8DQ88_9ACTN
MLEDRFPTLLAEAEGGDEDAFRAIYGAAAGAPPPATAISPEHLDGIADTADTTVLAADRIGIVAAARLISSQPRDRGGGGAAPRRARPGHVLLPPWSASVSRPAAPPPAVASAG